MTKSYEERKRKLIRLSNSGLTERTYNGWRSAVVNFLLDYHTTEMVEEFKALCGSMVDQIAPCREFVQRLQDPGKADSN